MNQTTNKLPQPFDSTKARLFNFAPWMKSAYKELGQSEIPGVKANPRVLQYFTASKFWGTDDSGGQNAWCASFVAYVMKSNGYSPVKNAFRAKSWKEFGEVIESPLQGSIAIKSRRGGGHVGFVVGKSSTGKYLFILGGNQGDKVSIARYPAHVWETFVLPSDIDASEGILPVYTASSVVAGSEE
ncbi:TIGR02594 family protein [Vibrio sp. SCSIO 43136]|uniref:TIGR02594 family protein n=1 Tax=Vibrio sp. SCSIO 43136 TaxID=2819101 RepID=UPI00207644B4|nr:TIGR02594 family protein [Vibrio sp. SCSIO 43136]USD64334.1 TIGR02594 family protein [Vibrio sp. SCSIO 43136]